MAISLSLLLPCAHYKKLKPNKQILILAVLCGVLFASDVAVWNIAIQNSSATQASLLVNLAPLWVGIISTYSLTQNQQLTLDWNDSGIIWNGYVGRFKFFLN
jgi:drug/metabolite transporter (DMT)-like permease